MQCPLLVDQITLIWRYLTQQILNESQLHARYQIWHAYYPSGPPPFYNAMMLRTHLSQILKYVPEVEGREQLVLVGHSMGGIIAKTMVVETGYDLWDITLKERPNKLIAKNKQEIQNIFMFSPVMKHTLIFFLDTPHQGSDTAKSFIGQIASSLVSLPQSFVDIFKGLINTIGSENIFENMRPFLESYGPNSVQVLRPGHPLVNELDKLPLQAKAYSIIGSQTETKCLSWEACLKISDGVVPFSSAFNKQSLENIIVGSSHDSYQSPKAIEFILNKLRDKEIK